MADGEVRIDATLDESDVVASVARIKESIASVRDSGRAFDGISEAAHDMARGVSDAASDAGASSSGAFRDVGETAISEFAQAEAAGSRSMGALSAAAMALGSIAAQALQRVADVVTDSIGSAASMSDSIDRMEASLDFAGLDTSTIERYTAASKDYADRTVYDLGEISGTVSKLAANGVADADRLTMAMGGLNAVAGGSTQTFGTFSQVMTQTVAAGKLTYENWRQLTDALPGVSGVLKDELADMGAYTGDFSEALSSGEISAEEFNAAISSLGLSDAAQEAATSTETFEGAFGALKASIEDVLMQGLDQIKPLVTDALGALAEWVSGIPSAIGGAIDALAPLGAAIAEDLGPVIEHVSSDVLPLFVAAWEAVSPVLLDLADNVVPLLIGAWDLLWDATTTAWSAIGDAIGAVADAWGGVAGAAQSLVDAIIGAWTALVSGVSAIWTTIRDLVTGLAGELRDGAVGAASRVASAFGFPGLVSAVSGVWARVRDGILGPILGIADRVWGIGYSISTGLAAGIRAGASAAVSAAVDMASSAVAAAKAKLEVGSPSKLMRREVGQWVPEGLAAGMRDRAHVVTDAMSDIAASLSEVFVAAPEVSMPSAQGGASALDYDALGASLARHLSGVISPATAGELAVWLVSGTAQKAGMIYGA